MASFELEEYGEPMDDVERVQELLEKSYTRGDALDEVCFSGYKLVQWKVWLHWLACILTFGCWWLFCYWYPSVWIKLTTEKTQLGHATHVCQKGSEGELTPVSQHRLLGRHFFWRCEQWHWDPEARPFRKPSKADHATPPGAFIRTLFRSRLRFEELRSLYQSCRGVNRLVRREVFDTNLIDIPLPHPATFLIREVLNPFYLFQVFSVILWYIEIYYTYATVIVIISTLSALWSTWETYNRVKEIREMAHFCVPVKRVLPDNSVKTIMSNHLVPGDIVEIEKGFTLPCDFVLLSGQCVINEAMLTGESIPVVKSPLPLRSETDNTYDFLKDNKYTLFGGTTIIKTTAMNDERVEAMVINSGFTTAKGELVRSILHPRPVNFKFYRDSLKFILFLVIMCVIGFAYTLYFFIHYHVDLYDILIRGGDLITVAVPPALPIALTVGVSMSVSRLKGKRISCIAPSRVNLAGRLNVIAFDKTGTLTEEGLDVSGVLESSGGRFTSFVSDINDVGIDFTRVLGVCHAVTEVEDMLIGDPLEVKMFQATQWSIEEVHSRSIYNNTGILTTVHSPNKDLNFGITKRFDFSSALQRMSVLAVQVTPEGAHYGPQNVYALTKGAPEVISKICDPSTVPHDFQEILTEYTRNGWRVLGCAATLIPNTTIEESKQLTREDVESLPTVFVGLLIMENKLKPQTTPTIKVLNDANITSIMCTGDNPLTAIYVAKSCNLIEQDSHVFVASLYGDSDRVVWSNVDDPDSLYNLSDLIEFLRLSADKSSQTSLEESGRFPKLPINSNIEFAITGPAFEVLMQEYKELIFHPHDGRSLSEILETNPIKIDRQFSLVEFLLKRARVYARMRPEQKQLLVESLMGLPPHTFSNRKYKMLPSTSAPDPNAKVKKQSTSAGGEGSVTVGFCGDGANDCGALKSADVGLSLSEAEASIAAPFTSKIQDISCMITLLQEGRCALVTSFQSFKYMSAYSFIQFIACIILYTFDALLSDNMFLASDLFIIIPLAFSMCRTHPYHKLVPQRPTSSLMSFQVIASLAMQVVIHAFFQTAAYLTATHLSWFTHCEPIAGSHNTNCLEVTIIFLASNFQYVASVFAFSVSKPFRKPFYTNYLFVVFLILAFGMSIWLAIYPFPVAVQTFFEMVLLPFSFRTFLLVMAFFNTALVYIAERVLIYATIEHNFLEYLRSRFFPKYGLDSSAANSVPVDPNSEVDVNF